MGQLVVAAAGAAVGGFFGMPQIGWAVGAAIGGALFAPKIKSEGPKVTDLALQGASAGAMIPEHRGGVRTAGTIIWDSGLKPTRHEETVGKGGGQSHVNWTYAVDMAISLGHAPDGGFAGVAKVWADGKLVWSIADGDFDTALASSQAFRSMKVYAGTEDQMPDPTMEEALGVGNVPAYRGQMIVVFSDFECEDYGNRRPNLTFQIIERSSAEGVKWRSAGVVWPGNPSPASNVFPVTAGTVYFRGRLWAMQGATGKVFSSADGRSWVQVAGVSGLGTGITVGRMVAHEGQIWAIVTRAGSYVFLHSSNGRTWVEISVSGGAFYPPDYGEFVAHKSGLYLVPSVASKMVYRITVAGTMTAIATWPAGDKGLVSDGTWVYSMADAGSGNGRLMRSLDWSSWEPAVEGDPAIIKPIAGSMWRAGDYLYMLCSGLFSLEYSVYRVRVGLGASAAAQPLDTMTGTGTNLKMWVSDVSSFNPIPKMSGAFGDFPVIWAENKASASLGVYCCYFADHLTAAPKSVAELVTEVCARRGIGSDLLELDAIAADTVSGFSVTSISTGRAVLEQLGAIASCDFPEVDGKLRAVKRGGDVVATLGHDDIGAREPGSGPAAPVELAQADPLEIPARVIVYYRSTSQDYNATTQDDVLQFSPSVKVDAVELGVSCDDDTAKAIAVRILRAAWMGRYSAKFAVPRRHALLAPGDPVALDLGDKWLRLRLLREVRSGGLIEWEAAVEDMSIGSVPGAPGGIFDRVAIGQAPVANAASPRFTGVTLLQLLDLPALRDQDNDAGFYAAMSGFGGGWPGATLYKSTDDGATWQSGAAALTGVTTGVVETPPASWSAGNFDPASFVVRLQSGALESYTQAAVLTGSGAVLVGDEIMLYTTAEQLDADRWRVSGLVRGLRGTAAAVSAHVAGERFVVLSNALLRVPSQTADIGAPRLFRGVSFSQPVESAIDEPFTASGRSLRPLSPAWPSAGVWGSAGDIRIKWVPRARIGSTLRSGVGVALDEASDAYEIDVYASASFASVVRTLSASSPAAIYSGADQITDFGATQSTLYLRIYRLSAVVGRGDPHQCTLTI